MVIITTNAYQQRSIVRLTTLLALAVAFCLFASASNALTIVYSDATTHNGTNSGSMFIPWNHQNYTYFEGNFTWYINNASNLPKYYYDSASGSHGGEDIFFEYQSGTGDLCTKNEPGFDRQICSIPLGQVNLTYRVNKTADTFTWCYNGGSCTSSKTYTDSFQNFTSVAWGNSGSNQSITRIVYSVLDSEAPVTPPVTGNSTITWISPSSGNVTNTTSFTVEVSVSCPAAGGNCSNVLAYLDPINIQNHTYPVNATSTVFGTKTAQEWVDEFNDATWNDVVEPSASTGTPFAVVRWYNTEGSCTGPLCENQLTGGAQCAYGPRNTTTKQFCFVTDEHGNVQLSMSMGTNQTRYELLHNFSVLISHPTPAGLQCWKGYVNGTQSYTLYSQLCKVSDSASDASIRIMGGMGIACAKQRAGIWTNNSVDYCADYALQARRFWGQLGTHSEVKIMASGRAFLCESWNNQPSCPTNTNNFRPDYYELQYVMDSAEFLENNTLADYTIDFLEAYYYSTLPGQNNIHATKTGHFNSSGDGGYVCDDAAAGSCATPTTWYMDNIDTWRAIPAMSNFYTVHPEDVPSAINSSVYYPWMTRYGCLNTTFGVSNQKPTEIYTNRTANGGNPIKSTGEDYKTSSFWLPLCVRADSVYTVALLNRLATSQYSLALRQFNGAAYYGAYFSQFAQRALGMATGIGDPNFIAPLNGGGGGPVSKGLVSTVVGDTPFWTSNSNPQSCGNMTNGSTCLVNWTVFVNGPVGQAYNFFAYVTTNGTAQNNTATQVFTIIEPTPAQQGLLYSEDFETCTAPNWTLVGYSVTSTSPISGSCSLDTGVSGGNRGYIDFANSTRDTTVVFFSVKRMDSNNMDLYTGLSSKSDGAMSDGSSSTDIGSRFRPSSPSSGGMWVLAENMSLRSLSSGIAVNTPYRMKTVYYANNQTADFSIYTIGGTLLATLANQSVGSGINTTRLYSYLQFNGGSTRFMLDDFEVWSNSTPQAIPTLNISAWNIVNGSIIAGLCVNATGTNTSQNLCNTTGSTVSFRTTGTYNITVYSIGSGNGVSQAYFNQTVQNYVFQADQNLTLNTSQALINLSAFQLFTNASITGFNASNGLVQNQTAGTSVIVPANNGSNAISVSVPGNYTRSQTCTVLTPLSTLQCNSTGVYDNIFTVQAIYSGSPVLNFSLLVENASLGGTLYNISTTNGTLSFPLLQGYEYLMSAQSSGLLTNNITVPANASSNGINISFFFGQSLNIMFRDELTQEIINETVTLELISDIFAQNYTTNNGTLFFDVLFVPVNYTLRYRSANYTQRDYYVTITENSLTNLTLYMISFSDSNTVLVNVVDTRGNAVQGAIVKLMRYYVDCNCYRVVEMDQTGYAGQGYFNAEFYEAYYKWAVDYNGVNYFLSTSPENLVPKDGETIVERTFTIDLGEDDYEAFNLLNQVGAVCAYNSTTSTISFSWNDPSNTVTRGCLDAEYISGTQYASVGASCQAASIGGLVLTLSDTNTTKYKYAATLTIAGSEYTIDGCAGWIEPEGPGAYGDLGAFLAAGILITLTMMFSYSASAVIVINAIGVLFISFMGLMPFSIAFIGGLIVTVIGLVIYQMRT